MNLQEIRARLAQLNNKTAKKTSATWKPKDEHDIRCLPQKDGSDPFIERKFHYDVDQWPILCPTSFGKDCPICEFAEKLRAWKNEDGRDKPEETRKADFQIFRKIQAKSKYYVAMVERGQETAGPMYWAMTDKVFKDLLKICADEDYNSDRSDEGGSLILTSPKAGHDLHVSFKKPGEKGNTTTFFLTEVSERKKPTKLMPSDVDTKKIVEGVPLLDEVLPEVPYAEVKKMLDKWIGGGMSEEKTADSAAKSDAGREYGAATKAPSNNAEKLTGTISIDDAFASIAGEDD